MPRQTFARIPVEKQQKILDVAAKEFALNGFHKANINTIASKACVSIGAMYKYFKDKEDLFSETVNNGILLLREHFSSIAKDETHDPFEKIRQLFNFVITFGESEIYYSHLYLALISSGMDSFADKYADVIEQIGHEFFKYLIKKGIDDGYIDKNIDIDMSIYFLDNHLMMFAFSQVSLFLKLRQKTFLESSQDQEYIINETVTICKRIFGVKK